MQTLLLIISILIFIASVAWLIFQPGFEPLIGFLTAAAALAGWYVSKKSMDQSPGGSAETLGERNRRVMLDQVESAWVKGILEESLHGLAMIELGILDEPGKVQAHPWRIERETGETLPAGMSMLDIFQEVGKGRSLLILGTPGSGKTTMLLELARQWIEHARGDKDEPMPVVFNLSTWDGKQTIEKWLADELRKFYGVPRKTGQGWIAGDQLMPLLDGLDEVRQERRVACVEAINDFYVKHGFSPIVVCSRSLEYGALGSRLDLAGAISLQPLTRQQVDSYIEQAGDQLGGVRTLLGEDVVLSELTETPLMLSIMMLAYKGVAAEELRGFPTIEARREHLFETYVERMFQRPERPDRKTFPKPTVISGLTWLAQKVVQYDQAVYLIERMQPTWLETTAQSRLYRLGVALITGLGAGLGTGLGTGLGAKLIGGLLVGLIVGLVFGLYGWLSDEIETIETLSWSWEKAKSRLLGGLLAGLVFGLVSGLIGGLVGGLFIGLVFGLVGGLTGSLIAGLVAGLRGGQVEGTSAPNQGIRQSLRNMLIVMGSVALVGGLGGGLGGGLVGGLVAGVVAGMAGELVGGVVLGLARWLVAGLVLGLLIGLVAGLSGGLLAGLVFGGRAVIQHYVLHAIIARSGYLPWRLVPFLDYAADRVLLRKVGGGYVFIHRLMMEHFAALADQHFS